MGFLSSFNTVLWLHTKKLAICHSIFHVVFLPLLNMPLSSFTSDLNVRKITAFLRESVSCGWEGLGEEKDPSCFDVLSFPLNCHWLCFALFLWHLGRKEMPFSSQVVMSFSLVPIMCNTAKVGRACGVVGLWAAVMDVASAWPWGAPRAQLSPLLQRDTPVSPLLTAGIRQLWVFSPKWTFFSYNMSKLFSLGTAEFSHSYL